MYTLHRYIKYTFSLFKGLDLCSLKQGDSEMEKLTFEQCKKGYEDSVPGSQEQAEFFATARAEAETLEQYRWVFDKLPHDDPEKAAALEKWRELAEAE